MPNFVVEHEGKKYKVEAATAEEAASAFEQPAPDTSMMSDPATRAMFMKTPEGQQYVDTQARSAGSGIVEGGQRLKAGIVQLGASVADYFGRFDKAGRGKEDLVTSQELLRAATDKAEASMQGLDLGTRNKVAGMTEIAALTAGTEMGLPKATTAIGALAKNVASGAIGGAVQFDPDQEKAKNAAIGGAVAGTIGLIPSLPAAVKNAVGRGLAKAAQEGRTAARVASMQKVLPNVKLSLAQRTGVPELQTLERANYNSDQVNFFADQTDQFIADAVETMRQPTAGKSLSGDFAAFKEGMSDHIGNIRKTASRQWDVGMAKATSIAKSIDPSVPVQIKVPNLIEDFKVVNDQAGRVLPSGGKELIAPAWLKEMQSSLQKGYLTPSELADSLKGLTALQKDDNQITKALATRLREGLEKDMDALAVLPNDPANMPLRTDSTVQQILDTRAEYRRAMQAANELAENAAYKMMGGTGDAPENLVSAFTSMSRGRQEAVRDYLNKNSPQLLASMKQAVMDDAIEQAGVIREAADSQQSLEQLQKALFDGDKLRTAGLWSPKELAKLDGIADGMRTIMNNRPLMGGSGTPIKAEDVTTNLISRSDIFLTRQFTRIMNNSGTMSKFFLDENVYKAMTKLNRSTTGSAANLAARATLLELLQEEY